MKIIHYFSGITICLFVFVHLFNHLLILRSPEAHIRFMNSARRIYRHPVIETILFVAVLLQVATGFSLAWAKWGSLSGKFEWLQIVSGLYLSLFLIVHVTAVLIGRHRLKIDTNLYYGAGVMNMWPHKLIFIPYYTSALLSFFCHVAAIHRFKVEKYVSPMSARLQGLAIIFSGIIVTIIIIAKMTRLSLERLHHHDLPRKQASLT